MNVNQLGHEDLSSNSDHCSLSSPDQLSPSITDTRTNGLLKFGSGIGSSGECSSTTTRQQAVGKSGEEDELRVVTYKGGAFIKVGGFLAQRAACSGGDRHAMGKSSHAPRQNGGGGGVEVLCGVKRAATQNTTDRAFELDQKQEMDIPAPVTRLSFNAGGSTELRNDQRERRGTGVGRHSRVMSRVRKFEKTALPQLHIAVKTTGGGSCRSTENRAGPHAAGQLRALNVAAATKLQAPPLGEVASKAAEAKVLRQGLADLDAALDGVSVWEGKKDRG